MAASAVAAAGPGLAGLGRFLATDPSVVEVLGQRNANLAVAESGQAAVLAAIAELNGRRPVVVAVPTTADAERLAGDLSAMLDGGAALFPAWETLPFERISPGVETMGRRCEAIWQLHETDRCPPVLVAPIRALLQRLVFDSDDAEPVTVASGDRVDQERLVADLAARGYRRDVQVEHRGVFAVRGSIVDVFPSTADSPVRIDLWGDEVDRLTEFSVADQRATEPLGKTVIFPAREVRPVAGVRAAAEKLVATRPWGREQWERLAEGQFFDGMESWLPWLIDTDEIITDRLGADALVVLLEPGRLRDRAADIAAEEADLAGALAQTWGAAGEEFPRLHLDYDRLLSACQSPVWTMTAVPASPSTPVVAVGGWASAIGDPSAPVAQVSRLLADGYRVRVAADGAGSATRSAELLREHGVDLPVGTGGDAGFGGASDPAGCVVVAPIQRGFVLPDARVAVLGEADLTGRRRAHRRIRPRQSSAQELDDLAAGDYVVHRHHGVGRYGGMVNRSIGGVSRDYLLVEYRGGDKLYVPTDQVDAVRRYSGGESPTLSKMGGADWQRTKSGVRSAVSEIAKELVVLYQRRITTPGRAFSADTPWQTEMESAFGYQLTPDQHKAIVEVKADMEQSVPMDRLICGDVGFGKTEVAIRAVFKAVQDGAQAAVLVPTTLLAQQHYQTFGDRFAGYPIRVEVLSRFLSPGQARKVVNGLADGSVDVVIGTHRLLSDDVAFQNLGLLVVDEEQRFGVTHKEAIKSIKTDVDVITLTATPIPRTLEMSLTGIRDLTLLHTPPADRQPILTYVGAFDERPVAEAIRRELLRDGQAFFVHNRVADIDHVAADLREMVPEARIAVAHGQMDEGTLEQVVIDFWERAYDVLVCTTIIESGIDMPTVNTLVVDRADLLGLGQLHQLRGRVGRAGARAYAYLFTPEGRVLTEEAYERLKTIGEATELGSGFKIAMRDLEIRGAGNMLGTGQSGHIAAVGYDLYCQLVTEAVAELKGETPPEPIEISIDVPQAASIPADYMPKEELRLEAYRRVAGCQSPDQVDDVAAEWVDRYGPIPDVAQTLLAVARLRCECLRSGVRDVAVAKGPGFGGPKWVARLSPVSLRPSRRVRLERLYPQATYHETAGLLVLPMASAAEAVETIIATLRDLIPDDEPAEAAAS
ncbi:MAG: transcription-repair coupling factor [Acidimicrobiia bacterium]|nr:transcription-repair coupling factor [Acidimicrobiia bacterium]MYE74171.1 transcription-repair coupling factor [Acidimicrobiia bacterium]MYJ61631.1 transcription-repair coupling factor [Acidimicrobiia bacterium]